MNKKILLTTISILLFSAVTVSSADTIKAYNPFTDVDDSASYANAVLWAKEAGVTSGVTDTTFEPNSTCTRAQVVTFLWRACGKPEPEKTVNPFNDVKPGSFCYKAVLWAVENDITSGTTETTFNPDSKCTEAQVLTFLWRSNASPMVDASGTKADIYPDGSYYKNAVAWADAKKMLASTFSPSADAPRADIVSYLYINEGSPEVVILPNKEYADYFVWNPVPDVTGVTYGSVTREEMDSFYKYLLSRGFKDMPKGQYSYAEMTNGTYDIYMSLGKSVHIYSYKCTGEKVLDALVLKKEGLYEFIDMLISD